MGQTAAFTVDDGHPNRAGHELLDALLLGHGGRFLGELDGRARIRVLRAAVERMPAYRELGAPHARRDGPVLYEMACELYGQALPYTEDDLCDLLLSARHSCGHGQDVRPPFDLALAHLRTHGYSPALGRAIAAFAARIPPPPRSSQLHFIACGADLVGLLAPDAALCRRRACWTHRLRAGLGVLEGDERAGWEQLVLAMSCRGQMRMPKTWARAVEPVVAQLGRDRVVARLRAWWPGEEPGQRVVLRHNGGLVLKHLVWLLGLLQRPAGEDLVIRLADLDYRPKAPMNVLKPAAEYLARATSPQAALACARLRERAGLPPA